MHIRGCESRHRQEVRGLEEVIYWIEQGMVRSNETLECASMQVTRWGKTDAEVGQQYKEAVEQITALTEKLLGDIKTEAKGKLRKMDDALDSEIFNLEKAHHEATKPTKRAKKPKE